jgi:hypothetical protein
VTPRHPRQAEYNPESPLTQRFRFSELLPEWLWSAPDMHETAAVGPADGLSTYKPIAVASSWLQAKA